VRAGFEVLIDTADDLTVVGTAANGAEAVALARQTSPQVILMDVRMPVMDGLEATARILAADAGPEGPHADHLRPGRVRLRRAQGRGQRLPLKDTPPADLLAGIRVVADGDALLSPSITRHLIEEFVRRPQSGRTAPPSLDALTDREVEVLELVARGLSNAEIAQRIYVSPATAKTHVARLLMKLNARDRAQLIIVAYESGLVTPRTPAA
jgi:DNA-binding NarL/FixJ family response regulator